MGRCSLATAASALACVSPRRGLCIRHAPVSGRPRRSVSRGQGSIRRARTRCAQSARRRGRRAGASGCAAPEARGPSKRSGLRAVVWIRGSVASTHSMSSRATPAPTHGDPNCACERQGRAHVCEPACSSRARRTALDQRMEREPVHDLIGACGEAVQRRPVHHRIEAETLELGVDLFHAPRGAAPGRAEAYHCTAALEYVLQVPHRRVLKELIAPVGVQHAVHVQKQHALCRRAGAVVRRRQCTRGVNSHWRTRHRLAAAGVGATQPLPSPAAAASGMSSGRI